MIKTHDRLANKLKRFAIKRGFLYLICTLFVVGMAASALAQVFPFSFLQQPTVNFTTVGQTIYPNICSSAVTLNLSLGGIARNVKATTVNFSQTGTLAVYSDPACVTLITNVVLSAGTSTATVYVMATAVASETLTATVPGLRPVTQTETVATNPFVWTGTAGDNVWKTNGNWSGGTAPSSLQVAYFDGTCATFCSPVITASLPVGGVVVDTGFAGTITQNSGVTLTIGATGWVQKAGTFVGSAAADTITVNGPFVLTAGSFTATHGSLIFTGAEWYIIGNPTFVANTGTVYFSSTRPFSVSTPVSASYNNVQLSGTGYPVTLSGTMTVAQTLTLPVPGGNRPCNGGQINVAGDVLIPSGWGYNGSTVVNLNGSGNQKIDATGAAAANIPQLTISSTGGTVSFIGSITINGNYNVVSGTVAPDPASTIIFSATYSSFTYTPTNASYNNVWFASSGLSSLTLNGILNVKGTLSLGTAGNNGFTSTLYAGTAPGNINAYGDIVVYNHGTGGTNTINIMGSGNQKIDGTAATFPTQYLGTPNLNIASTGGTVTFLGNLVPCSVSYTSGTVDFGTSTMYIGSPASGNFTFNPGSFTFGNLIIAPGSGKTVSITGNITTTGTLSLGVIGTAATYSMPAAASANTLTVGTTFTVNTAATLNLHGATHTETTYTNSGTVNP
jgi:hypothetical protein